MDDNKEGMFHKKENPVYFENIDDVDCETIQESSVLSDAEFNKTHKKRFNWLKVIALMVVTSLVTLSVAWQLGGFEEVYQPPTRAERHGEFLNFMDQRFKDGDVDTTLFEVGFYAINLQQVAGNNTRLVSVNFHILLSISEIREQLQLAEEDELPQSVVDSLTPEGFFPIAYSRRIILGFLMKDLVVMPVSVFRVEGDVSIESAQKIFIEATLLPNLAIEDDWKTEILFSGTLAEFIVSENLHVDGEHSLVFLSRPEDKLIVEPDGFPDKYLNPEDIALTSVTIYTKSLYGEIKIVEAGSIMGYNDEGYIFVKGNFANDLPGAAVYVLQDGNPVWIGMLSSVSGDIAFVLSARIIVGIAKGLGFS